MSMVFMFAQWMWLDGYAYVIYRFVIAVPLLAWACEEIPRYLKRRHYDEYSAEYFFYATTWAYYTYVITLTIFALFCAMFACKKSKSCLSIPFLFTTL